MVDRITPAIFTSNFSRYLEEIAGIILSTMRFYLIYLTVYMTYTILCI